MPVVLGMAFTGVAVAYVRMVAAGRLPVSVFSLGLVAALLGADLWRTFHG